MSLGAVLRFPKTSILIFSALTVAGFLFFGPRVKSDFVPLFDKGELSVKLEYPDDITLERAAERTQEIAAKLADVRDAAGKRLVVRHTVSVGKTQGILGQVGRGNHLAQVDFVLRPMTERRETIADISALMRARLGEEPDVLTSVLVPTLVGGAAQSIQVNFPGPEGRPFTLGAVAEVTRSVQQVQIVRSEKRRSTIVYANNAPGHGMGEVVDRALARAKEELPRGLCSRR